LPQSKRILTLSLSIAEIRQTAKELKSLLQELGVPQLESEVQDWESNQIYQQLKSSRDLYAESYGSAPVREAPVSHKGLEEWKRGNLDYHSVGR
jgi:hypothetical protein